MENYYTEALLDETNSLGVKTQSLVETSGLHYTELKKLKNITILAEAALKQVGEVGLGLRFGHRLDLRAHGIISYALMSCTTLGDVIQALIQYNHLLAPHTNFELCSKGDFIAIRTTPNEEYSEALARFLVESFFSAVQACAHTLFPRAGKIGIQQFNFSAPPYLDTYKAIFKNTLEFEAEACQLVLPASYLSSPLGMKNPAAKIIFQQQCDARREERKPNNHVSNKVVVELTHHWENFLKCKEIASRLNMSESTLRRKLRAEGTSFQKLLDQLRAQLAHKHLKFTRVPVAEVARLVGFEDTTNFRRSFKKWTGTTPSSYRNSI